MDNQTNTPVTNSPQPQSPPPGNQNPKKKTNPHVIWGAVVAILIIALGYLAYDAMQQSSEISNLETEVAETRESLEEASADSVGEIEETAEEKNEPDESVNSDDNDEAYIGTASQNVTTSSATIGVLYEDVGFEEFHLEYGVNSNQLKQSTSPEGGELRLGPDIEPGLRVYELRVQDLEPGKRYFYKIVGSTESGETVESDLASFLTKK